MTKIKEYLKTYFSTKTKIKIIATLSFTMIFLSVILSTITSFANQEPIKSITITSEELSYTNQESGAWKITKSAKWISKGKAQITFTLDTIVKTNNIDTDVILVLDTSGSMSGERLDKLKQDTTKLITDILSNENNSVSLIAFNTKSTIISNFTNDLTILTDSINYLEAIGNTNYYQALVNVDNILKNYTWNENKDCIVLFLTDGYPNIDSPNEVGQYNYLKNKYPKLTINSIQYEMGEEPLKVLKKISDNQYNANTKNLKTYLYRASMSPLYYENFKITDYINTEYFKIESETNIKTNSGQATLQNSKITWDLGKINSGSTHKLTIDIEAKEEHLGLEKMLPTNEQTIVISSINNMDENITTKKTPILSDTYRVIYEENSPEGCTVAGLPSATKNIIFDTVRITDEIPICEGYKFKDWEIVNKNIKIITDKTFIMPEENVTIRATWKKLSTKKSMDGNVSKAQSLYEMMRDNSVPDNIPSEFVIGENGVNFSMESHIGAKPGHGWIYGDTNGKGIYLDADTENEQYPVYYYRGDINYNNLIFANFCWEIVRTTSTGGIKLIYNGVPNENGHCTATSENNYIGTSAYNNNSNSMSSGGYMYGEEYIGKEMYASVAGLGGKSVGKNWHAKTTNYIYAKTITYNNQTNLYILEDGENRIWHDTYSVDNGNQYLYTCESETEYECEKVVYIINSSDSATYEYVEFSNGETASIIENKEIVYGNDVEYDEITGKYILKNTITSKISNWKSDYETIAGKTSPGYHYTCLNTEGICEKVIYIYYIYTIAERNIGQFHYIELDNGIKIEDAVSKMTTNSSNEKDSIMKIQIDTWYENNLITYEDKLEDTIWCNDRNLSKENGWNKDGNAMNSISFDRDYGNNEKLLKCINKNDAFTVNDTINGNGQLKYPIALLTSDEINMAGGAMQRNNQYYYLKEGAITMTPALMHVNNIIYMITGGEAMSWGGATSKNLNIRPSISLKHGTKTFDGDGTEENPYIVK